MDNYQDDQGSVVTHNLAFDLHQYFEGPGNMERLSHILGSYVKDGQIKFHDGTEEQDFVSELLHEVVLKALEIPEKYPGKNIQAWLLGISVKILLQKRHKLFSRREIAVSTLQDSENAGEAAFFDQFASMIVNGPEQQFATNTQLQACLASLPQEDQRMLVLYFQYGLNHNEIAKKLAINHAAARTRFRRILNRLRKVWDAQENGKGGASYV